MIDVQDTTEELRIEILNGLGLSLATKRQEAMAARAATGIEDEWIGDEEFYQGYDDANRHEFSKSANKPLTGGDPAPRRKGSTVFPNITQAYVDAAAARVGDMLLPTDDRNYAIESSPIPDMLPEDEPPAPVVQPQLGVAPEQPGLPQPVPAAPPRMILLPDGSQVPLDELREKVAAYKAEATRKAEKAQTHIDDWLTEAQFPAEVRKAIDASAKLGSGVLKGPVPVLRTSRQWRRTEQGDELIIVEEIKPASKNIDCWNLFPDGACGESIHNGAYIFERDYLTPKRLKDLKKIDGYLTSQIDLCLEEGPQQANEAAQNGASSRSTKGQFEIWYFYGSITPDELQAAGVECEKDQDSVAVMLTMVNDRVIHAALNPLDDGSFPYDIIPWKRRPGMPWGMGVARQMRTPQRIVVAATRNLMDNAGQGAGPQFVIRRGIEPQDGKWEITPLKIWRETEDADGQQTGAPFMAVLIPMLQNELSAIIQMGMKMAEDVTGLPQLMQGSQGSAPDTVGGLTILNNNANAVLRRIARLFDSCLTEPHIKRYIAWLMEYGEDPDEKGDFNCIARGSTALVERDLQSREMPQILQMCANPAFGIDPKKAIAEFLKSRRFDPDAFAYSEEDQAKLAAQQPNPPPAVAVAQIRAKADAEKTQAQLASEQRIAQMENETEQTRIRVDTDRDVLLTQSQQQKNEADAQARMAELQVRREIEILKYSTQQQISLATAKTQLARDSLRLGVQKELAAASGAMDLHKHYSPPQVAQPAVEPAGRAPEGQAFQR